MNNAAVPKATSGVKAFEAAFALLEEAVRSMATPGAVLASGWGTETDAVRACGSAEVEPEPRAMTTGTAFDLASLTKVVATLPVVLHLLATNTIGLGTRVADVLEGFGSDPPERAMVTVEHLLTHTSGLPGERKYWRLGLSPDALRRRFLTEPLVNPPGLVVTYSDLGFMLLGWLVEAVTGQGLGAVVTEWVCRPLGLASTGYGPWRQGNVAATELGPDGRPRVGVVHDGNAAALQRPAGHSGLFSTAGDLTAYLQAWTVPGDSWLPRRLREEAVTDRTASLNGHRGLGWVGRHDGYDQLSDSWPESAVFHSGFTGTSLALDMPSGRWVVMLTNDVHFGRDRGVINDLRRAVHSALAP